MLTIKNNKGTILITVLLITAVFLAIYTGLIGVNLLRQKLYLAQVAKQQSLHIAEAGVNYYRWHLAHNKTDYFDGNTNPGGPGPYGPYEHDYNDPSGVSGKFSLTITPPPSGSSLVIIKSTGWTNKYSSMKRTLEVTYGIPSLAHYSFLTNTPSWFGDNENLVGEVRSNSGIRMDGDNDSLVSSAVLTYTCPKGHDCYDQTECNNHHPPCNWIVASSECKCPGVWGSGTGLALWRYPITNFPFTSITADYTTLRAIATSTSDYYISPVNDIGYHLVINNDRYTVYKINTLGSNLRQYNDDWSGCVNIKETISSETSVVSNRSIPNNGVIFFENDLWIEGTLTGRLTVVAVRVGGTTNQYKSINIRNNLRYAARDGSNMLGLIAQKDIKVLREAAPVNGDTIIDGFLLANNGHVFRNLYCNAGDRVIQNRIEIYGGIISFLTWNWTWGIPTVDGYDHTTSIYDANGTYAPPPAFPTTGEYAVISWKED